MSAGAYDIVTVGGGLAASSLALVMAREGVRVLVLEREPEFRDRVRGEALVPWGVGEAQQLGIYDLLKKSCGHEQPWFDVFLGPHQLMHRDLLTTTPQRAPVCSFYHPKMQEALIRSAAQVGADIRRGANVTGIEPGPRPIVKFQHGGQAHEVRARLVVAADGRVSPARKWIDFAVQHDPPTLMLAGVLLDNVSIPEDVNFIITNPMFYQGAYLFPQGGGRARVYFAYPVNSGFRMQGEADVPAFISACVKAGAASEYLQGARTAGPLASFETADTWVPHPYKNGVALIGDAAASSDPSWGNGMALSLRSVRILRDRLLTNSDWDSAGNQYAEEFARVYDVIHSVTTWSRQIFMESGPEADARRERALPLIAQDATRVPDHGIGGPDLPFDKNRTRARFFGEI
jgi:2-polyprenyl-6-methoxyphenol hydroxylase-like FAD-dependent oxidoreductase